MSASSVQASTGDPEMRLQLSDPSDWTPGAWLSGRSDTHTCNKLWPLTIDYSTVYMHKHDAKSSNGVYIHSEEEI